MSVICGCYHPFSKFIHGLSTDQTRAITITNVAASAFSFAGSGFIVACYLLFKELRKFSFKLVFYLALSDMLCSLFNLLGDPGRGLICYVQGYATQFFSVASFLWTTTISFTLHRTVVRHKADVEELGPIFHLYVWGTSLIMAVLPSIGTDYAQAGTWCWVQAGTNMGKVLWFVSFYVPLWGAILFNGIIYFQVIRMLENATRMAVSMSDRWQQIESKVEAKVINRLGYYPLILIGSWAFGTINRIYDFVEPHQPIFWLYILDVGTAALMGFFNSIAYGLNASVRRTLKEKFEQAFRGKFKWLPWLKVNSYGESEMVPLQPKDGS